MYKRQVLDWIHAANGNVSADVARTYLLLALEDKEMAETYLSLFCARTRTEKAYVQGWLPLVAAAQLTKKRKKEAEQMCIRDRSITVRIFWM